MRTFAKSAVVLMAFFSVVLGSHRAHAWVATDNLGTIVAAEILVVDNRWEMKNDIQRQACKDQSQIIDQIEAELEMVSAPNFEATYGIYINPTLVRSTLEKYTKEQIIAAEVADYRLMAHKTIISYPSRDWQQEYDEAQKKGDEKAMVGIYSELPLVAVDTTVEGAVFTAPIDLLTVMIRFVEKSNCHEVVPGLN